MLKVAMLSKWHVHAGGYANDLIRSGKVEITAVWDDDKERGSEWAKSLNADFEPCLDTLLKRDDVEAVICDAPTTMHRDVLIAAANAGKKIFTEKALAPTLAECYEIKEAIEKAGVLFTISYPHKCKPSFQLAKKLIESGDLGRVTFIRYRNAHSGVSGNWLPAYWFEKKDTAGGAMMDLGCHPMYVIADLCGKPKRITGLFNAPFGTKLDENAIATVEFENGCIGVAETGFLSFNSPETFEVYGSEGTLIDRGGDVKLITKKTSEFVNGYVTPNTPQGKVSPLMQFVDACINGTGSPEGMGIDDAIALTELLEASYIADEKNSYVVK